MTLQEGAKVRFKRPLTSVNAPPKKIPRGAAGTVLASGPAWDLPLNTTYVAISLDEIGEVTVPLQTCMAILEIL